MSVNNILQIGRSSMMASKSAIGTTGHNISNANTEGYNRQRVEFENKEPVTSHGRHLIGNGVDVNRITRINDEYLDKQIRTSNGEKEHFEEKDLLLDHLENVFNELDGDGLNRVMGRFFNEFRKLASDPNSEAVRESVREATNSLASDFRTLRKEVEDLRKNIDSRLDGYVREANSLTDEIKDLNIRIKRLTLSGSDPNDLMDKRDLALKKLEAIINISTHTDKDGSYVIDLKNVGPLVSGPNTETLSTERSPKSEHGKPDNALDLFTSGSAHGNITGSVKGGKIGALLSVRDHTLSGVLDRLDELAFAVTKAVNQIHSQGFTRDGRTAVNFFNDLDQVERASEKIGLSEDIRTSVNNIATGVAMNAPGDNRIAVAISGLQGARLMSKGTVTVDDFYNSIVSDVGVIRHSNKQSLAQTKNVVDQLGKIREQISGVSLDEETANLLKYQHAFDASARIISTADQMLRTVLELKKI